MRHVKTLLLLAVILAVSLAPAAAIRLFPRETSTYLVDPLWKNLGPTVGSSKETLTAIWIIASFVLAIAAASALLLVLARGLIGSTRENG